jgi:hypothetical protein
MDAAATKGLVCLTRNLQKAQLKKIGIEPDQSFDIEKVKPAIGPAWTISARAVRP